MDLREAMELKAQLLRDMASDNLRGQRKFRDCLSGPGREMGDWYEGRYEAYKKAAEMITDTLEMCA